MITGGPLFGHHFAVEECILRDTDGAKVKTHILTIKADDTRIIKYITGYEFLCAPFTGKAPRWRKKQERPDLYYVSKALNYIFKENFWKNKVTKLTDVTADMVFDAFDHYSETRQSDSPNGFPSQQSINKYIYAVSSFFANVALLAPDSSISPDELMKREVVVKRQGQGQKVETYVPIYRLKTKRCAASALMREIPVDAMQILISQAEVHDPMLVFAIIASSTAGLRVGELCNMRQEHSPVSYAPGIMFHYVGSTVTSVKIDLTREYSLRADPTVDIGGIKKHRVVTVYPGFIAEFMQGYRYHQSLLEKIQYDKAFCPMFVDRNGQAMTRRTMHERFKALVNEHFIPALYDSGKIHLVAYAQDLESLSLTPHALRHYFTVRLVLEGLSREAIADFRGDRSLESAEIYVRNKGAFAKQLQAVHDYVIDSFLKEH